MNGLRAMIRRQLRINRAWWIVMVVLMAVFNVVQIQGYHSLFPNPLTRDAILSTFANNSALRIFYGYPFDIRDTTGWMAWRNMATIGMVMAIWAAFVTIGALRGEEEAGRAELTVAQPQSRRVWFAAVLAAVTIETLVIGLVSIVAMAAVGVSQGSMTWLNCLELSLQMILPALLFIGVGGLASQLIGSTRGAKLLAAAVLILGVLIRTPADIGNGIPWLRWLSPLGWFEELRPPRAPSIAALGVITVATVALVLVTLPMLAARDIGVGLLPHSDSRPARRWLLGSTWQAGLREDLPQLSIWLLAILFYAALMGGLTKTVVDVLGKDPRLSELLGTHFGFDAWIAGAFSLFQLIVALLAVTLLVGARAEEGSGRLELLVATPLSRISWLLSRAILALAIGLVLAMLASVLMWTGASAAGQTLPLGSLLGAGMNCLPVLVIAVGCSTAILAFAPRAMGAAYAVVGVAFVWEALGAALKAPGWVLDVSPFHYLAQIPAQPFAALPAIVVTGVGAALIAVGVARFRARDLVGT